MEGASVDCSSVHFKSVYLRYKKISAVENSIASMTSEALLAELRKNDQPRKGKKAGFGPILKPSSRSFEMLKIHVLLVDVGNCETRLNPFLSKDN